MGTLQLLSVPYALNCGSGIVGPASPKGDTGITGAQGNIGLKEDTGVTGHILQFGMFHGLTAETGNLIATDYAATIAVKTTEGNGRVPFPRNRSTVDITRNDATSFTLPTIGTYEITLNVRTT
jgi:hypothetical protein